MFTQINPRTLGERRNDTDVFNRLVIAGLLNLLNNTLTYEQVWEDSNTGIQKVTVPFLYEMGTSNTEKFIQDNYVLFGDTCEFPKIIGNFDMFPRGTVRYTGSSIDAANITNRFVLGNYIRKEPDGSFESYVSFLYSIPLTMNFEVSVKVDTLITSFKLEQAIREFFYKNKTFWILYRGMKVGCRAGFPENISSDKTVSYKMGATDADRNITLSFSVVIETYQPVFDPTTEMKASNTIKDFAYDATIEDNKAIGYIKPVVDYSNSVIPSGLKLYLQWNYIKDIGDMRTVNIDVYKADNTKEHIATLYNTLSFVWEIPEGFTKFKPIEVVLLNNDHCKVHKKPLIKIIPDPKTKKVSPNMVFVENTGFFLTELENDTIEALLYYQDKSGKTIEKSIWLNIYNCQLDSKNPASFEPFDFLGAIEPEVVNIKISDTLHPELEYVMESVTII